MRYTKLRAISFALMLGSTSFCMQARNADVKRIEIDKESSYSFLSCDGIGESGLILTTKEKDKQKNATKDHEILTFTKYDTLLAKTKSIDANTTDKGSIYQVTSGSNLYRISMTKGGEYEILFLDGEKMTSKTLNGDIGKKTILESYVVMGDYIYLSGLQKGLPFVCAVNVKSGVSQLTNITPLNKKRFAMMSFEADINQKEVHLFTKELADKGYIIKLYVFVDGKQTNEISIAPDSEDKYPATAFASKMSDGSYIISGTYSPKDTKRTDRSTGVFLKKVSNGNTVFSNYTNYLDLKNFTSYMSERKQERVEKKKAKKEAKDEEFVINYNMLPYKVIEDNGKYLLVGEAYYPTYRMESYTVMVGTGNGGMTQQTMWRQVFDGFAYTHYFVMEFDGQGKMEWSNSAPIEVLKSWVPRRHLSVSKNASSLEVVYPSFGHMNNVSYGANGEEVSKEEIKYVGDEQKLKRYYGLDTEYWFGENFLSSGLLKIKDDDGKRRIFSINKISF